MTNIQNRERITPMATTAQRRSPARQRLENVMHFTATINAKNGDCTLISAKKKHLSSKTCRTPLTITSTLDPAAQIFAVTHAGIARCAH